MNGLLAVLTSSKIFISFTCMIIFCFCFINYNKIILTLWRQNFLLNLSTPCI